MFFYSLVVIEPQAAMSNLPLKEEMVVGGLPETPQALDAAAR
jgi:hypothetical protein